MMSVKKMTSKVAATVATTADGQIAIFISHMKDRFTWFVCDALVPVVRLLAQVLRLWRSRFINTVTSQLKAEEFIAHRNYETTEKNAAVSRCDAEAHRLYALEYIMDRRQVQGTTTPARLLSHGVDVGKMQTIVINPVISAWQPSSLSRLFEQLLAASGGRKFCGSAQFGCLTDLASFFYVGDYGGKQSTQIGLEPLGLSSTRVVSS